jgi:hypothetical protein
MADEQSHLVLPHTHADRPAAEAQADRRQAEEKDRPLDPEKLLRLAGLVRAVLEEVRQMDPDAATAAELALLHQRVTDQVSEGLPNLLRSELEAIDLALPFRDGATGQEVRVAYAGLIGWLSGLFQGLQAAMQYQQMQQMQGPALQRGSESMMERGPQHATGQYL